MVWHRSVLHPLLQNTFLIVIKMASINVIVLWKYYLFKYANDSTANTFVMCVNQTLRKNPQKSKVSDPKMHIWSIHFDKMNSHSKTTNSILFFFRPCTKSKMEVFKPNISSENEQKWSPAQ